MAERRYSYGGDLQIRQDAGSPSPGTIQGAIVVYGDTAPNPYGGLGPERMLAGAWGPDADLLPWTCNLMHNRRQQVGATGDGLTVQDSDAALTAELVLPDSELGRETAYLARNGKVRGLSGEFDILQQYVAADGVRNVVRVAGDAIGLVDNPAYRKSTLNIRQNGNPNVLLTGPAGAGKSQVAAALIADLPRSVVLDFQSLYAALLQQIRDDSGRYPPRLAEHEYIISLIAAIREDAIERAAEQGVTVVLTNSNGDPARRSVLLGLLRTAAGGDGAREQIVDPGIRVIVERLTLPGATEPSQQCIDAGDRYYGVGSLREYIDNRTAERRTRRQRRAAL